MAAQIISRYALGAVLLLGLIPDTGNAQPPAPTAKVTREWLDRIRASHYVWESRRPLLSSVMAESLCRKALGIDPSSTNAVYRLMEIYADKGKAAMAAMAALHGKDMAADAEIFQSGWTASWYRVLSLPQAPAGLNGLPAEIKDTLRESSAALRAQRFIQAEMLLRNQLNQYPRSPALLSHLGNCYILSQDWSMSAMLYGYMHHLYPDDPDCANNYGMSLEKTGRKRAALKVMRDELAKHPDTGYLLENCGTLCAKLGMHRKSAGYLKRFSEIAPGNARGKVAYAIQLVEIQEYTPARQVLVKAMRFSPELPDPYYQLARISVLENNPAEAFAWLREYAARVPTDALAAALQEDIFRDLPGSEELLSPDTANSPAGTPTPPEAAP